jgi:hypothetical protein
MGEIEAIYEGGVLSSKPILRSLFTSSIQETGESFDLGTDFHR